MFLGIFMRTWNRKLFIYLIPEIWTVPLYQMTIQYVMKEYHVSDMLMVACGVDPQTFAHRRAWLMLEMQCFWTCIGVLMVLLAFKARLCGGGEEIGTKILDGLNCCTKGVKVEDGEANDDGNAAIDAIAKDTGVM